LAKMATSCPAASAIRKATVITDSETISFAFRV
jgi:hypothetical protein